MDIGAIWDLIILNPMINGMIWLSDVLFGSFGLTIIILTFVVRGIMYPLTMKQMHATKSMQELQPKMQELQKKYAKDKQRLAQEQMKLYKESGFSPAGCLLPMLLQMPVWIALYQAIIRVLATTPEDFLNLSDRLYNWDVVYQVLPLNSNFLWFDLAFPDYALALLVGLTMYLQQKMSAVSSGNPQQQAQARMMQMMMPLMFIFFSISFPSGLALYWVASAIIGIVIQYFVTGWGGLQPNIDRLKSAFSGLFSGETRLRQRVAHVEKTPSGEKPAEKSTKAQTTYEEVTTDESSRDNSADREGGGGKSAQGAKHHPRKGKDKRRKRR